MSITRLTRIGDPTSTPGSLDWWRVRWFGLVIALLGGSIAQAVELEWQPQRSHDVETSFSNSIISITTTGTDPYLVWRLPRPANSNERVLEFEYFCADGIESVSGYLGPPITELSRFELPDLDQAEGWQTYRVDLVEATGGPLENSVSLLRIDPGTRADVRIQMRHLRLRARTPQEETSAAQAEQRRQQKQLADQGISHYLKSSFPDAITDVHVEANQITIEGTIEDDRRVADSIQLVELPPHQSLAAVEIDFAVPIEVSQGKFRHQLPRRWAGRDRLHSAWRLKLDHGDGVSRWQSARHYATTIELNSPDVTTSRAMPTSQKGLSAVSRRGPLEELPELGIHAITINLVLNQFLTDQAGEHRERIQVEGPPVYFNPDPFAHYDDLIDFCRRHEIVVSAIVLITQSKRLERRSPLVHPESDGGVYAMPDLASPRGAQLYAFLLDRIAQRYRNPSQSPGGITNWIAHNEIDFHRVWTNMGPQPRRVLIETYYRSMRIIDTAARQHNPHARVFASLTHHWVVPDDGKWKQLSPRETIESLQRFSQMEGDFPWGIAYHPYPQSLFAETAWNDSEPQPNFETPLITIQNLEVLGQFLDLSSMQDSHAQRRPVLLSEQGFHTRSYHPEDQELQASSLLYAMNKVRKLPWVESFHYHRWIDHPDEGGLLLGLRTVPDEQNRYGLPKLSWEVYRAIGTEQEREVTRSLQLP